MLVTLREGMIKTVSPIRRGGGKVALQINKAYLSNSFCQALAMLPNLVN